VNRSRCPVLLLTIVLSAGCVSSRTVPLAKTVAMRGQEVATAALAFYDDVDATVVRDKSHQDFVRILLLPPGSPFPDKKAEDFSEQLKARRAAYKALKSAYGSYQAIADSTAPADVAQATAGLADAANTLGRGVQITDQAKSLLGTVSTKLVEAQRSRNLRKHNEAFVELVNAYRTVWLDDVSAWRDFLTGVEVSYSSAVAGIPPTSLDAGKIGMLVTEPVASDRKIPVYQLQLINAERARIAASEEKMRTVTRALDALVAAHSALASDKPSAADVLQASNQILQIMAKE